MKLPQIPMGELKPVAGVFGVGPVVPGEALALRPSRRGHELVQQGEGQAARVVAVSDAKPQLLAFAAINGLAVKNYTEKSPPEQKEPDRPDDPEPQVYDLSMT
jgi:hypothetical protein